MFKVVRFERKHGTLTADNYLRLVLQYYCKRIVTNFNMHLICTVMETIRGHLATCLATCTE